MAKRRTHRALEYRVVELSTVDEATLERALNEGAAGGWTLETIQFAMRESSKRPAMAFVLFTREGAAAQEGRAPVVARQRLMELAGGLDDKEP